MYYFMKRCEDFLDWLGKPETKIPESPWGDKFLLFV